MKLWKKSYTVDERIEKYTVGDDPALDLVIAPYDCVASMAHAKMLHKIGILKAAELDAILTEMDNILQSIQNGNFNIDPADEDCHTAIENRLTQKLGETGKKIHTARSRNDQVLTALRLYYKHQIAEIEVTIHSFLRTVEVFIDSYGPTIFPGYTHTRKAMPSSMSMWAGAILSAMEDNLRQLKSLHDLIDQSPLGTAAGYGVPLEIDREFTAAEMGFARVQRNPIYAQMSRGKFEGAILHLLSFIMFDLNKFAGDLILFSMPEFAYFSLPDQFLTGSSIMPHKKNPDVLELVRANYHRVTSAEFEVKSMIANLINGYHRDFQLLKAPVIRGFDITLDSLAIMDHVFANLKVNAENCSKALSEELYATEKVYELVKQGRSFRDAYREIGKQYEK